MKSLTGVLLVVMSLMTSNLFSQTLSEGYPCRGVDNEIELRMTLSAPTIISIDEILDRFVTSNSFLVIYSEKEAEDPQFFIKLKKGGYAGYVLFNVATNSTSKEYKIYWPTIAEEHEGQSFYQLRVEDPSVSEAPMATLPERVN